MIENTTKEYRKFYEYYTLKDEVIANLIRSCTFLPFGLEAIKIPTIFTENVPLGAPAATDFSHIFMNLNDSFFQDCGVNKLYSLTFAYLHEIAHNIFAHHKRGEGKDQHLWQYSTDYFINLFLWNIEKENKNWDLQNNLIVMQLDKYKDKILFNENFSNLLEEEIYNLLQKNGSFKKEESTKSYKDFLDDVGLPSDNVPPSDEIKITKTELNYNGQTDKKTFVEFPKPKEIESGDGDTFDSSLAKTMFESRIISKGFESQAFEKFIKRMFQVKVDWQTILRDSILVELQKKSDISYGRPRLVWLANPTLPYLANINEEEILGTAIISVDESGSVSDKDISDAINLIEQSSSYYKDLLIIKHDTKIVFEKKYNEALTEKDIDELLIRRAYGGTNHSCIFQRVVDILKQNDTFISIVICVTDMYSDIEESQKILPSNIPRIYIRSNTEYNTEKITGKIINIE